MAKYWVDPPSGWMYGFPKIWDSEVDPLMSIWIFEQGYPQGEMLGYIRVWPAEESWTEESPHVN